MKNKNCCTELQNIFENKYQECFSNKTAAKEKNRTFIIEKPSKEEQFCRIEVDNCLISNDDIRKCDFVFIRCNTQDYYFVELKGSDTEHALKQLENTINYFKRHIELNKKNIHVYVVSSRVPSNSNQRFNNLKKRFRKNLCIDIQIATNKLIKRV